MGDEHWCPEAAMKAYLCTLHLCKDAAAGSGGESRAVVAEPECMEFISALAAGNGAQLIVEIASKTTPLTLALAVAAKQTGGQFVCILPAQHQLQSSQAHISARHPELQDSIFFVSGDPCEVMMSLDRQVDFAVISDGEFEDHLGLLEMMMRKACRGSSDDGRGCVVVERLGRSSRGGGIPSFGEAARGRDGVESVSLPVSGGVELTRVRNGGKSCGKVRSGGGVGRRCRRFHVIVENR